MMLRAWAVFATESVTVRTMIRTILIGRKRRLLCKALLWIRCAEPQARRLSYLRYPERRKWLDKPQGIRISLTGLVGEPTCPANLLGLSPNAAAFITEFEYRTCPALRGRPSSASNYHSICPLPPAHDRQQVIREGSGVILERPECPGAICSQPAYSRFVSVAARATAPHQVHRRRRPSQPPHRLAARASRCASSQMGSWSPRYSPSCRFPPITFHWPSMVTWSTSSVRRR